MVNFLPRLRLVGEVRMRSRVGQIDGLAPVGNEPDKAFALLHA